MTNKEILGELKQCWEYITDIKDNEYEQLTKLEYDKLSIIRKELYEIYEGFRYHCRPLLDQDRITRRGGR